MVVKKDPFLSDLGNNRAVRDNKHFTLMDGFRLGFGFTVGFLFVALILGSLIWGISLSLHG